MPDYINDQIAKRLPSGGEAVSYTHLDVYKRQVEHLSERLKLCANTLSDVDLRMQEIFDYLNGQRSGDEE